MGRKTRSRTMLTSRSLLFSVIFVLLGLAAFTMAEEVEDRKSWADWFTCVRTCKATSTASCTFDGVTKTCTDIFGSKLANKAKISCIYKGQCRQKLAFLL